MDRALAARKGRLTDVKIRGGLVIRPRIEVVECDPEQISFHYYSWHLGDYERKLQARGLVQFLPMILRSLPCLYRDPGSYTHLPEPADPRPDQGRRGCPVCQCRALGRCACFRWRCV